MPATTTPETLLNRSRRAVSAWIMRHPVIAATAVGAALGGGTVALVFLAISERDVFPTSLQSNMFELELERLFELEPKRRDGGALAATDDELLLVSGSGHVRVLDLAGGEVSQPDVELPPNGEPEALAAARAIEPEARSAIAVENVEDWLRYQDVLVFDDAEARRIVLSYAVFDPDGSCFQLRVATSAAPPRTALSDLELAADDWDVVFASQPCFGFRSVRYPFAGHQAGGRIDVLDAEAGTIVLSLGDFEFDGIYVPAYPRDPEADYGKTLAIDLKRRTAEVLSVGHRNAQGITVDDTGRIWTVEHGPQGGDELNRIERGVDYGWPQVTLGINYGNRTWPYSVEQARHSGYRLPNHAWVPSIGVSNLDQITGFHPFWDGDLIVFSMHGRQIVRVRLDDERVVYTESIDFPERIRYGLDHPASGSLYLWTDTGEIFRLKPGEHAKEMLVEARTRYEQFASGSLAPMSAAELALARCLECHGGPGAPDLAGVVGRPIAGTPYPGYSRALARRGGVWDEDNLRAFLLSPQDFAPGTTMSEEDAVPEAAIGSVLEALATLQVDVAAPAD